MSNLSVDEVYPGATYPNLGPSLGQAATGGRLRSWNQFFRSGAGAPGMGNGPSSWTPQGSTASPTSARAYSNSNYGGAMANPGMAATKPSMAASGKAMDRGDAAVSQAVGSGQNTSAFGGLFAILALLFLIMWLARYLGKSEGFSHIKPSFYNAFFVALVAVAGIPIVKFVFVKLANFVPATAFIANYVNAV